MSAVPSPNSPSPDRARAGPHDRASPSLAERFFTRPFLLLLATQTAYGFVYSEFLLLPKYLARELHASADTIGWVMSAGVVGGVLFVPAAGALLDGRRRGSLIVIGGLVGAAASLGLLAVTSVGPLLIALALVLGMAFVLVFNASGTMAADLVPPSKLGQALGIWGLATLVTNAIAPVTLEPIADRHGWAPVFVAGAVGGVLAASLGGLVALGEPRPAPAATRRPLGDRWGGDRLRVLAAAGLTGLGLGTLFTFVVPYAIELGAVRVRGFFVGYTVAAVAIRVLFGDLADRYGRARVSLGALLAYGLAVGAAILTTPDTLALVGVGLGIAHGVAYPSLNALFVAGEARAHRGSAMASFFGAYSVGRAAGVAVLGLMAHAVGYPAAFVVGGAILAAGAFILLPLARAEARDRFGATYVVGRSG
ncbi:MAG: MFS transporter [Polyangiaceae bacterium]|nr:MFS transporter [Polyangiaceae bacterium]